MQIQKIDVTFQEGAAHTPEIIGMLHRFENYVVELQSLEYPDNTEVVLVLARSEKEAIYQAFWTRNIASSWKAVSIAKE